MCFHITLSQLQASTAKDHQMQLRHRQIMLLLFIVVLVVDVISHFKTFHLQTVRKLEGADVHTGAA